MRSRTKAKPTRRERGANFRTRLDAFAYSFDRLAERVDALEDHRQPSDLGAYSQHDDRIATLEERVRNLTDYINRNRV